MSIDVEQMTEPFIAVSNKTHCHQILETIEHDISLDKPHGKLTTKFYPDQTQTNKTHVTINFKFVYPFETHYALLCQIKATLCINKTFEQITPNDLNELIIPVFSRASQVAYNATNSILGYPIKCDFALNKLYRQC